MRRRHGEHHFVPAIRAGIAHDHPLTHAHPPVSVVEGHVQGVFGQRVGGNATRGVGEGDGVGVAVVLTGRSAVGRAVEVDGITAVSLPAEGNGPEAGGAAQLPSPIRTAPIPRSETPAGPSSAPLPLFDGGPN
jgi:hypothetical protein